MAGNDYYVLLDVRRDASAAELKRAYELALQRASRDGATRHSIEIVKAYEVLSHPGRRAVYDQTGLGVVPERVPNTYGRAVGWRGGTVGLGHRRSSPPAGQTLLPSPSRRLRSTILVALGGTAAVGAVVAGVSYFS